MNQVIGIDFGTTSSRVSIYQDGKPYVIKDIHGDGTIPSYVALNEAGDFLVGEAARRYATRHPARVAFSVKRLLGLRYDHPSVAEFKRRVPFSIIEGEAGMAWVEIDGCKLSPVTLCSLVVHRLKSIAECYLEQDCDQCVLTVPADFNELQRLLLIQSASDAGLEVLRTVAEPTAASLTAGLPLESSLVAIYDLGGGTFDITILEYDDGLFDVKDSRSDLFLGGEDFDFAIADRLSNEVNSEFGIDIGSDAVARSRLKTAAEIAKISLSFESRARIDLPFLASRNGKPLHFASSLGRDEIEADISDLVDRTLAVCKDSLQSAGVKTRDLDKVILVGGSTRIPLVTRRVEEFFGLKPEGRIRREDAVVLGAAIQAGILAGDAKDVVLLDVVSTTIGFGNRSGSFFPLIPKGTTAPTIKSAKLRVPRANKNGIKIDILEEIGTSQKTYNVLGSLDFRTDNVKETEFVKLKLEVDASHKFKASTFDHPSLRPGPVWHSDELELSGVRSDFKVCYPVHLGQTSGKLVDIGKVRPLRDLPQEGEERSVRPEVHRSRPQIFLSYAREDTNWLETILTGLGILATTHRVEFWHDDRTQYGDAYRDRIFQEIERSWMCILVLSPAFLSSSFVINEEIPRIFAEHERRGMKILPLMARPCAFTLHGDIEKLQSAHDPKEPLAVLSDGRADEVLASIAIKINDLLE